MFKQQEPGARCNMTSAYGEYDGDRMSKNVSIRANTISIVFFFWTLWKKPIYTLKFTVFFMDRVKTRSDNHNMRMVCCLVIRE